MSKRLRTAVVALWACLVFAALSLGVTSRFARAADTVVGVVDFRITGAVSLTDGGSDRVKITLRVECAEQFTGAHRRDGAAGIEMTLNIDGKDFTFAKGKYVIMLQDPADNVLPLYLKRQAGEEVSGGVPAGYYNETYPGLTEGEEHTVRLYEGSTFGRYRLAHTCEIVLTEENELLFAPQPLSVTDGKTEDGIEWKGDTYASAGSKVTVTPVRKPGFVTEGLAFADGEGNDVSIEYINESGGAYSFVMPDHAVSVRVLYKEAHFTLTVGDRDIPVRPGMPIGAIPEGVWTVDGYTISEKSNYVWQEDKVAVRVTEQNTVTFLDGESVVCVLPYTPGGTVQAPALKAKAGYDVQWEEFTLPAAGGNVTVRARYTLAVYTLVFMADGKKMGERSFTAQTESIELPVIPQKEGFVVVGWDLQGFPTGSAIVNAIYKRP